MSGSSVWATEAAYLALLRRENQDLAEENHDLKVNNLRLLSELNKLRGLQPASRETAPAALETRN